MARKVQIDFTDRMIKIAFDGQDSYLRVHKHLLSDRSSLLEAAVEQGDGSLCWQGSGLDLQAASRYVGFLYGQPMWTYAPGAHINREWYALNYSYNLSTDYEDFDAADACVDGMREILQNWRKDLTHPFDHLLHTTFELGESYGRLVVDYMVHRSCDIKQWIDAYEKSTCRQGSGSLQDALSKKFVEEAQRTKDGINEPDLIERCRYHLHVEKGLPCYLDK